MWQVKRSGNTKNALEVTVTDKNGRGRSVAFTTTIKSKSYISLAEFGEEGQKKPQAVRYDIYQYTVLDHDTIQFRGMDSTVIAKAITDKKLGGEIAEEETPVITDSSAGIIRYLEAHAEECYPKHTEYDLIFKRQVLY